MSFGSDEMRVDGSVLRGQRVGLLFVSPPRLGEEIYDADRELRNARAWVVRMVENAGFAVGHFFDLADALRFADEMMLACPEEALGDPDSVGTAEAQKKQGPEFLAWLQRLAVTGVYEPFERARVAHA